MSVKKLVNQAHLFGINDEEFVYPIKLANRRDKDGNPQPCFPGEHDWDKPEKKAPIGNEGKQTCRTCGQVNEFMPLFGWLEKMLRGLPREQLDNNDGERCYRLIALFRKVKTGATIELRTDDYQWLSSILFDDDAGRKLSKEIKGAFAIASLGFEIAVTISQLVKGTKIELVNEPDESKEVAL